MPDQFTTGGKLRRIQTGAYNNTWGGVHNADVTELIDDLVTGIQSITLTGSSFSMPAMTQGADSDSRAMTLRFVGSPSGPVTVTFPSTVNQKVYVIDNQCGQTITFTYGGVGATVAVATALRRWILCDGTNVYGFDSGADASSLGGIAAANFARRDAANIFSGGVNSHPWVDVAEAPTTTINAALGNHQRLTLTGNRTMAAPSNPANGQMLVLLVIQDASGSRTLTWDAAFLFENGTPPTLASGANARNLFVMFYDSLTARWSVGHFSSISSTAGAGFNVTLDRNETDVYLAARIGSPATPVTVNVTVAQGVVLQALSAQTAALDLSGLPSGSVVNLTNLGYIIGKGGRGGDGATVYDPGSGISEFRGATNGRNGGPAIRAPGAGITFNITNASGRIWGGGGGGGGGGASAPNPGASAGGAGGGGAGGGLSGMAGKTSTAVADDDDRGGASGVNGAPGSGSAGAGSNGGNGGNGGTYGQPGVAGDAAVTFGSAAIWGAAGAAGKAIELGGGTANFVNGNGAPNVLGAVS